MSDLVKRLRTAQTFSDVAGYLKPAADRIEELERELRATQAERQRAQEACEQIAVRLGTARREALEQAARICDAQSLQMDGFRARECAAAIRKLVEAEGK